MRRESEPAALLLTCALVYCTEAAMKAIPRTVMTSFIVAALAALAGCAGAPASSGSSPAAEAPEYRVGDRWTITSTTAFA